MIWGKDFLEAGKQRLLGDMRREADSQEVEAMRTENEQLKALVAEMSLKNRVLTPALAGGARVVPAAQRSGKARLNATTVR
jgi:transposase